jgi:uncharacterized repeat protein (TIGR02543 family)
MKLDGKVIVSGIKSPENSKGKEMIIRFYSLSDAEQKVKISFAKTPKKYKVSFDVETKDISGDLLVGEVEITEVEKIITFDEKFGKLPEPKLEGYEFQGWYLDKNYEKEITDSTIVDSEEIFVLYAKWVKVAKPFDYNMIMIIAISGVALAIMVTIIIVAIRKNRRRWNRNG